MKATVELFEDGGEAASGANFFRSLAFLEAESTTHTLHITHEDGTLVAPVLVRSIDGSDRIDAISPYGYPGLVPESGAARVLDPASIDFSGTGLVSLFIRHRLGTGPSLEAAHPRNVCLISDPSLPRKSRMSDRQQVRKNLKRGYSIEITPGAEARKDERAGFLTAYTETMRRTDAAERYFYDATYFDLILDAESTWLVIARSGDGGVAAASIAAVSDGLMHYYLSGTADNYLRDSSMKNVLEAMIEFAAEMDLGLNLGGGITRGDPLEEFKRGFANREEQWFTSELICDRQAYDSLSSSESGDFFPAYRAPATGQEQCDR